MACVNVKERISECHVAIGYFKFSNIGLKNPTSVELQKQSIKKIKKTKNITKYMYNRLCS